jgi:hypothetical protein
VVLCVKENISIDEGKYTFADGDLYEGDYMDDKMNGKGKYTFANGKILEGEWKDDSFQHRCVVN